MTKLLVRTHNEHVDKILTANPADYLRVVDELTAWLDLTFTVVGTDRYTLDVEHEQHMRQIASEFDALFGTLLAGGWYNNHDH